MSWWRNIFGRKSYTMGHAVDSAEIARLLAMGTQSGSGVSVTDETALSVATVYSCTAVLSESVAQLPCILYSGTGTDDRKRATDHRLYSLLKVAPNEWQTAFEFWERAVLHASLRGNFYAMKGMVGPRGREELAELMPIPRNRVRVKTHATDSPYYVVSDGAGNEREVEPSQIFHLRYRTLDGWEGLSPISYQRETIGLQIAGNTAQASLYKNGAKLSGVLKHPKTLGEPAIKRLREMWDALYSGAGKVGKTAVLEEGMDFVPLTISNADLQYIEQRKLGAQDICAIYRVPPHMVANLERATHTNIEQQHIEFITQGLGAWLRRIETSIHRDLLSRSDRGTYYAEFLTDSLLRGDSAARGEFYSKLFSVGALSTNDICRMENKPPVGPEGDVRYVPGNLMRLGSVNINNTPAAKAGE